MDFGTLQSYFKGKIRHKFKGNFGYKEICSHHLINKFFKFDLLTIASSL